MKLKQDCCYSEFNAYISRLSLKRGTGNRGMGTGDGNGGMGMGTGNGNGEWEWGMRIRGVSNGESGR